MKRMNKIWIIKGKMNSKLSLRVLQMRKKTGKKAIMKGKIIFL